MRFKLLSILLLALIGVLAVASEQPSKVKLMKFQVQLLWGTNDPQSPDPKHKPVDDEVAKKLKDLPLKWSNYFVVNRKTFDLTPGGEKKEALSEKCEIILKDHGKSLFDVTQLGKGEVTYKATKALPVGEILIVGGNAPGGRSYLVVIKRIE